MIDISILHSVYIKPGSKEESKFVEILDRVNVEIVRLHCRPGYLFWREYDEYIISDGLYKQISIAVDNLNKKYSRRKHTVL